MRSNVKGKRKPSAPCAICLLGPATCLCAVLPVIESKTRLTLVIHFTELRRTSNTGQLAHAALVNSERIIRGQQRERLDLSACLDSHYQPLLLYPSDDAVDIAAGIVETSAKPVQLIVPDGNWRQASKVHSRHPELAHVPRVFVRHQASSAQEAASRSRLNLRRESRADGMPTLWAIALAMGAIEGALLKDELLWLYKAKAERVLWSRGRLRTEDCRVFKPA